MYRVQAREIKTLPRKKVGGEGRIGIGLNRSNRVDAEDFDIIIISGQALADILNPER